MERGTLSVSRSHRSPSSSNGRVQRHSVEIVRSSKTEYKITRCFSQTSKTSQMVKVKVSFHVELSVASRWENGSCRLINVTFCSCYCLKS